MIKAKLPFDREPTWGMLIAGMTLALPFVFLFVLLDALVDVWLLDLGWRLLLDAYPELPAFPGYSVAIPAWIIWSLASARPVKNRPSIDVALASLTLKAIFAFGVWLFVLP